MTSTVVIHQPDFLPYLGFFHRLLHADKLVLLDDAQFVDGTSRSWTNRDKIKTKQGARWITISVAKAPHGTPINQIRLSEAVDWRANHVRLFEENYRKSDFFAQIFPFIKTLYHQEHSSLLHFNVASIEMLCELLDVRVETRLSSTLGAVGRKNELLVAILEKVGASRYLSGVGARAYFEAKPYEDAGIEVVWQEFHHPVYPQLFGDFVPFLSAIDLLFNCGVVESRRILRSSQ